MKEALAHALEVEAVRRDSRSGRIREITSSDDSTGGRRTFAVRCYACGERGHFRNRCPRRPYEGQRTDASVSERADKARGASTIQTGRQITPEIRIYQSSNGNSLMVNGIVNGVACLLTIDTGATRTVIGPQLLRKNGKVTNEDNTVELTTATGQRIPVKGEQKVAIKIGEKLFWQQAVIADIIGECIIGLDFLRRHRCTLDIGNGILKCGEMEVPINGGCKDAVWLRISKENQRKKKVHRNGFQKQVLVDAPRLRRDRQKQRSEGVPREVASECYGQTMRVMSEERWSGHTGTWNKADRRKKRVKRRATTANTGDLVKDVQKRHRRRCPSALRWCRGESRANVGSFPRESYWDSVGAAMWRNGVTKSPAGKVHVGRPAKIQCYNDARDEHVLGGGSVATEGGTPQQRKSVLELLERTRNFWKKKTRTDIFRKR